MLTRATVYTRCESPLPSPITELEVDAVLSVLPPSNWLRAYVNYAASKVPSHKLYHVGTGLALLGACASPGVNGEGPGFLTETFSNFYSLIVGRSALAQKTIALNVGRKLLLEAASTVIGPDPGSEEALFKSLAAQRVQIIFYPEMGAWLANTTGADNYRAKLRDAFTGIYDGISDPRTTARSGTVPMRDPRLSLLGACTPAHLEVGTRNVDWEGGFMSRFLICYSDRAERRHPIPAEYDMKEMHSWLVLVLREVLRNSTPGACAGLTPDAQVLWSQWVESMDLRIEQILDPRASASWSRSKLLACKIGILLTAASGYVRQGQPWQVDATHVHVACSITEMHLRALEALLPNIAPTEEGAELRRVLNAVGPTWGSLGEVSSRLQMNLRRCMEYLGTLMEWGVVEKKPHEGVTFYRRVMDGAPAKWPGDALVEAASAATAPPLPPGVVPGSIVGLPEGFAV